ncbi:MAG: hypothetical protein ACRDP8_22885 [Actinopolymorphaceae bacterium]
MADDLDFEFTRSRRRRIVISQPRLMPVLCRDTSHRWVDEDSIDTYCRACGATRYVELWDQAPDDTD